MKKISTYTRKQQQRERMQASKPVDHRFSWAVALTRSSTYEQIGKERAANILEKLRMCIDLLKNGTVPPERQAGDDHDEVMHALATARIRSRHIAGSSSDNPAEPILKEAILALERMRIRWAISKHWQLTDHESQLVDEAFEAYRTILLASTPIQMEKASSEHLDKVVEDKLMKQKAQSEPSLKSN